MEQERPGWWGTGSQGGSVLPFPSASDQFAFPQVISFLGEGSQNCLAWETDVTSPATQA